MKPNRLTIALALTVAPLAAAPLGARADDAALAPREEPAKSIPVPTDVSHGMQKFIAAPLNPVWHDLWKPGEEWREAADKMDAGIVPTIELGTTYERSFLESGRIEIRQRLAS